MLGRAAITTSSPGWSPPVISSKSRKPVGTPGEFSAALHQRLDVVEGFVHLVVQAAESGARLLLPDLEDLGFRRVEQVVCGIRLVVAGFGDLRRDRDQAALDALVANDPRVVDDIGSGRLVVRDFGEEDRAADRIERLLAVQVVGEGVEVDRLVRVLKIEHREIELAVGGVVEIFGYDLRVDGVDRVVVEE